MFTTSPPSQRVAIRARAFAFTLIELLVVMTIIAVLMGLLFPVAGAVMRSAKKTQAKNDALQIAAAIKGYYTEYGRYPFNSNDPDGDLYLDKDSADLAELFKILIVKRDDKGDPVFDVSKNPRLIVFLGAKDAKNGKGGIDPDDNDLFKDPWGNAYQVVIDGNYDNQLTELPEPFQIGDRPVRDGVAVFSPGDPDEKKDDDKKAVATWQ